MKFVETKSYTLGSSFTSFIYLTVYERSFVNMLSFDVCFHSFINIIIELFVSGMLDPKL